MSEAKRADAWYYEIGAQQHAPKSGVELKNLI